MGRLLALTIVAALGLAAAATGYFAMIGPQATENAATTEIRPVWTEAKWPFPVDQWGTGRAFNCKPTECGAEVNIYLRAKLGSCNCETGVADDADLDRMSDFDLVGGEVAPLGAGRPITIARMKGRSRAYTLTARNPPGKTAISVAFNDRCDMVVATVLLQHDRPATIEPRVMEFLNGETVLHWAEVALGI
jgi:hypothetical protein